MLFDRTSAPRSRRPLVAVSVAVHLVAVGALLALPRPKAKAIPQGVAVVFMNAPRVAPRPPPSPARRPLAAQRRAGPRTPGLAARPSPLPVRREPEVKPIVLQGLTLQSTARAVNDVSRVGGVPVAGAHSGGSAPSGGGGIGRLVDAGDVTEPPAVVARAELRRFYPAAAMQNGFEGDVKLRLLVAQDGTLAQIDVLHDPGEGLGEAGARAIRAFRFRPARVNGAPVATVIAFTLHFVLG